ncbi:Uncharacterized conserved protein [Phaffia rhodozyma]|uniref:Uncharacterized conserved protein n=1 Tax=Phaffia rhodozyma TaxID=264483 RepID=A0A0F7SUR5_PHARH|nr:Uncharacterized conserved protein [Phaffia rhodozyma]
MPIGPSLPPHLQLPRPDSPDDEEDEDDAYGPSLPSRPAVSSSASSSIGPSLPPSLARTQQPVQPGSNKEDSGDDDDEESGSIGPALPPHLQARRQAGPSVSKPQPRVGPTLPPSNYQAPSPPSTSAQSYGYDDDSDDDLVGPVPVPEGAQDDGSSALRDFEERQRRWAEQREEAAKPKEMKREEWMLKPPEASDFLSNLDPTKIPRGQTAFSRTSAAPIKKEDQSLWTETPAERKQRLADEVSGKRKRAENSVRVPNDEEADEIRRRKIRDAELQAEIDYHNKKHRGSSLLDIHGKSVEDAKKKGKDGGPPPIWDRDLHMSVGGKLMDDKDRTAKILDAQGLGSRFGHAKGGAYS